MVLPLPLVPFESYMLADDRPAYPMNSLVRLRFSGRFDRPALETALSTALSRHPLLTALVCGSKHRRIWRPAKRPPTIQWLDTLPAESLPRLPPLDVRVMPGMRVAVCEGPGQTHMILQVHHACCDGLGMFAFAEDLLTAYATTRGLAAAPALRPLRPELLEGRGRFDMTTPRFLKVCPNPFPRLDGTRRFLLRAPEPLVPHQPQTADRLPPPAYPASLTRPLDESRTGSVLAAAKTLGVTLNDLLARELFLTLGWWRQRHAPGQPDGWLRLCVPMNLRTPTQDQLPAANVVSMIFLDRRDRDLRNPQQLLASLHNQMQRIKRLQLGPTFVRSVGLCQRLPGLLERMCRARRCLATAVFTNLGVLFERCPLADRDGRVAVDGSVLQEMDLLPPLRPLTCATFTTWSYARRLYFTLHYDPHVLAEGQARELIEGLVDRLPPASRPPTRGTQA